MSLLRNKKAKKKNVISILLTLMIILGLVVAGPVSAVRLNLKTDKSVYRADDTMVIITASVDIQRDEIVPFETLKLKINENFKTCDFNVDGTNTCNNFTITLLNPGMLEEGNLNGRGFGFENMGETPSTKDTDFGFGYGFEDENRKSGLKGELLYEIKWHVSGEEVPNGRYEAELEAFAEENGVMFTYLTRSSKKFNMRLNDVSSPKPRKRVTARATYENITNIGQDSEFSRARSSFTTSMTLASNGIEIIGGRTTLSINGETNDGAKVQFQVRMREHTPLNFEIDDVEIEGPAQIRYQRNKPGDQTIRIREDLSNVHFQIKDGKVTMSSADPTLPFEVLLRITRFSFR